MEKDKDQAILTQIARHVGLDNKDILEIGCGDGRVTAMLARNNCRITAVDPDEQSIVEAEKKLPGVDLRVGGGESLPFDDKSFDTVVFTLSLHHHQHMDKALNEASRVLRDNGIILVIEPVSDDNINEICYLIKDEALELSQAQEALKRCGLKERGREHFIAEWEFENEDELFGYLAEYGERDITRSETARIREILGKRLNQRPIPVDDKLVFISLTK